MLHAEDDEGMSLDGADLLVDLNVDEWLREWDEQVGCWVAPVRAGQN